jgi:hypothetical protein
MKGLTFRQREVQECILDAWLANGREPITVGPIMRDFGCESYKAHDMVQPLIIKGYVVLGKGYGLIPVKDADGNPVATPSEPGDPSAT